MGIGNEFFGLGLLLGANGVCSEFIDGLGCQAQMSHNGYTYFNNMTHLRQNLLATLQLEGIGMRDLHDFDCVGNSL